VFWRYESLKRRGLNHDVRKDNYENLKTLTIDQLDEFFKANIADKTYTYLVIGKKEDVNFDVLRSLGEVQELTLEDVFGE
jgi:zinc protease